MKNIILSILFFLGSGMLSYSQNVGINADGSAPYNAAMLDVKSTSRGFLLPRMTMSQRDAIANPDEGLMVYCTNCGSNGALSVYSGSQWKTFQDCITLTPVAGSHLPLGNSMEWKWTNNSNTVIGFKFGTTNDFSTATNLGNLLAYTETGLSCNTTYTRYIWAFTGCGVSIPLVTTASTTVSISAPDTTVSSNTTSSIIWKWKAVEGATGYKWSATSNIADAIDVGATLSYNQTGLTAWTLVSSMYGLIKNVQ